THKNPADK
nr:56 kda actin-sequestering protein, ASP-56=peptide T5a [swine, platelets, Peptide Partial, 8 aa] [Sus scrofa]